MFAGFSSFLLKDYFVLCCPCSFVTQTYIRNICEVATNGTFSEHHFTQTEFQHFLSFSHVVRKSICIYYSCALLLSCFRSLPFSLICMDACTLANMKLFYDYEKRLVGVQVFVLSSFFWRVQCTLYTHTHTHTDTNSIASIKRYWQIDGPICILFFECNIIAVWRNGCEIEPGCQSLVSSTSIQRLWMGKIYHKI